MGKKSLTADETCETPARRGRRPFVFLGVQLAKAMILLGVIWWAGQGLDTLVHATTARAVELREQVLDKLTVTKVVAEYKEPDAATLGEIIQRVSKENGIDPLVMAVIAQKESAGGKALYHFEPGKFQDLQGSKKYRGLSTDELRMMASSHGSFHVMGYSALEYCGLQWHALYNPWTSARCAASIVSRLYKSTEDIRDPGQRVREVFKRYNGSGADAERYADDAMNRLAMVLYKGMVTKG